MRSVRLPARALALAALGLVACHGTTPARPAQAAPSPGAPAGPRPPLGPNYSSVPCAETCGRDAQCVAGCTPLSNQQPLPPSFGR